MDYYYCYVISDDYVIVVVYDFLYYTMCTMIDCGDCD